MSIMDQTASPSRAQKISRWFVPVAFIAVFGFWFYNAPPGLLGKADAVGYAICHRIGERSFHMGSRQLPLCARCTGEFYAAGLSLLFLGLTSKKKSGMPGWKLGAPLIIFFVAFGIDGSNSYLYLLKQTSSGVFDNIPNLYIPNNTLRLFTGSGMGIALASVLLPAFNQSAWKAYDPGPALNGKQLAILVGTILIINLLILTENSLILYPIAILSVLGVLALLIMVFSMAWVLMMREENSFESLLQMWLPFLAGTTLGFLLITLIDVLRFRLTGTWGGFPLG
jgi:uncharacterized membrane protein